MPVAVPKKTDFERLGLAPDAREDEIRVAYKKLLTPLQALKWHPDRHTDDKEKEEAQQKFIEISDAYTALLDQCRHSRHSKPAPSKSERHFPWSSASPSASSSSSSGSSASSGSDRASTSSRTDPPTKAAREEKERKARTVKKRGQIRDMVDGRLRKDPVMTMKNTMRTVAVDMNVNVAIATATAMDMTIATSARISISMFMTQNIATTKIMLTTGTTIITANTTTNTKIASAIVTSAIAPMSTAARRANTAPTDGQTTSTPCLSHHHTLAHLPTQGRPHPQKALPGLLRARKARRGRLRVHQPLHAPAPPPHPSSSSSSSDWLFPLAIPLEDLYAGATHRYRITRTLRSGATQSVPLTLHVARGWRAGTRVRVPGAGNERREGGFQDIVFVVGEAPHARFVRAGDDLVLPVQVPWREVPGGGEPEEEVYVQGLGGEGYALPIPRTLVEGADGTRVVGGGMPVRKHGRVVGKGDLVIKWEFVFPEDAPSRWHGLKKSMHWRF
ncbi:hypothetical protein B0H21DRAFT_832917 [Amylocystis lapponica]|nr:hypothetical protein B0H21DRAFT_832917 [Amylocystis lapponica]